jgi:hypothetical protein
MLVQSVLKRTVFRQTGGFGWGGREIWSDFKTIIYRSKQIPTHAGICLFLLLIVFVLAREFVVLARHELFTRVFLVFVIKPSVVHVTSSALGFGHHLSYEIL